MIKLNRVLSAVTALTMSFTVYAGAANLDAAMYEPESEAETPSRAVTELVSFDDSKEDGLNDEDLFVIEGGANETDGLSDEELQEVLRDNERIQSALDIQERLRSGSSPNVPYKLNVTPHKQVNDHYCGVASTQMVLEYCTNKTWNQYDIGEEMKIGPEGASSSQLARYLRNAGEQYKMTTLYDSDFGSDVIYSITASHPMIASVKDGFPYKINTGHFICIHGFTRDSNMNVTKIYYIDPVNNTNYYGKQSMSYDAMYDAIDSNGL